VRGAGHPHQVAFHQGENRRDCGAMKPFKHGPSGTVEVINERGSDFAVELSEHDLPSAATADDNQTAAFGGFRP
jgi:hypothetical protein